MSAAAPVLRVRRLAEAAPQPWRNGGGITRELLAWPSADDWQVRVSVADIVRDGPFSAFPGVARWFAVIEGAGVRLVAPGIDACVQAASPPLAFDGALAPDCRLLDGPTRDLNLMLRGVRGRLHRAAARVLAPPAACGLFTMVAGRFSQGDRGAGDGTGGTVGIDVPAGALLWLGVRETGATAGARTALRFAGPAADADAPLQAWWIVIERAP